MAQVTVPVFGNVGSVGADPKNRLKIDETSLEGMVGLEKCFGFSNYRDLLRAGKINSESTLSVWTGFVNRDSSVVYTRTDYRPVDEHTLNGNEQSYNPKKILEGINWWYSR